MLTRLCIVGLIMLLLLSADLARAQDPQGVPPGVAVWRITGQGLVLQRCDWRAGHPVNCHDVVIRRRW